MENGNDFWEWFKKYARKAGRAVATGSTEIKLAVESPETPVWAKTAGVAALVYVVNPADPFGIDPFIFHDDLLVIFGAITSIGRYVTPEMKEQARKIVENLFGPE